MWGEGYLILDLTETRFKQMNMIVIESQRAGGGTEAHETCKHHKSAQKKSFENSFRSIISTNSSLAHFLPLAVMTGSNVCRSHVNYIWTRRKGERGKTERARRVRASSWNACLPLAFDIGTGDYSRILPPPAARLSFSDAHTPRRLCVKWQWHGG